MKKRMLLIPLALLLAASLVAIGCPAPAPAPAPVPVPEPAPAPTPAPEAKVIIWKQQTGHPAATPYFESLKHLGDVITEASGGRLVIESYPAGSICPTFKEYDAVDKGILDACLIAPFHLKEFGMPCLFAQRAGGPDPIGHYIWWTEGGGFDLWAENLAQIVPNVETFPGCGWIMTPEIFMHSKVKVEVPKDMVGLKMRTAGEGGEVLIKMGLTTLWMPHEEIYEALQRGVLDCAESGGPQFDWSIAYQEVAHYCYVGTLRQPSDLSIWGINNNSWAELPDDLRALCLAASRAEAMRYFQKTVIADAEAIEMFRDYGNEVLAVPDSIKAEFRAKADEYYAEYATEDPFAGRVLESMYAFEELYYGYVGSWD